MQQTRILIIHNIIWIRKNILPAIILGCFFAAANFIGSMLEAEGQLSVFSVPKCLSFLLQWILFGAAALLLFALLDNRLFCQRHINVSTDVAGNKPKASILRNHYSAVRNEEHSGLRYHLRTLSDAWIKCPAWQKNLFIWAFMMVVDFIVLLGVYPGFFAYDAYTEWGMVHFHSYTTYHPLAHVLLLGGLVEFFHDLFGSYNRAVFAYELIQMALILGAFTYMLSDIRRRGAGRVVRISSILWLILCPTVTMYVLCTTKDSLFSAFLIVMTVELRRLLCDDFSAPDRTRHEVCFVFCAVLMQLFRSNGMIGYAAFLMIYALVCIIRWLQSRWKHCKIDISCKEIFRRILLYILPLVLYTVISNGLVRITNADTSGDGFAALTVPVTQLARTYSEHEEAFTEEEKEILFNIAPESSWESYRPKLADMVMGYFDNPYYQSHKEEFWTMWFRLLQKYPGTYLNAWLMTSYGEWYPDAIIDCYTGIGVYEDSSYFGFIAEEPAERSSKIPVINEWYRYLSWDVSAQKVPILHLFLSPGAMFWVFAFMLINLMRRRQYQAILTYIPTLMVWMTVLLGPCSLVRYVIYLWFEMPLFAAELTTSLPAPAGNQRCPVGGDY